MAFHARLSPSSAHRWTRCPGAPKAESGLPDEVGYEAAQGTVLHDIASAAVEYGADPYSYVGRVFENVDGHSVEITEELVDSMIDGLEYIDGQVSAGGLLFVEKFVDLSHFMGEPCGGTLDIGIIDRENRRIIIFDWKFGSGVPVHAEENEQLMMYAMGFWDNIAQHLIEGSDIEIELRIEQPRLSGGGGTWIISIDELFDRCKAIWHAADITRRSNDRIAGEKQCRFCSARFTCSERARYHMEQLEFQWDQLDEEFTNSKDMTPEQRSKIVLAMKGIKNWLKDVHEFTLREALSGRPTPGLKVVEGRKPGRKWGNESEAEKILLQYLKDDAYEKKLKTPPQVEKVLGRKTYKDNLEKLVNQGRAKPILVSEDDPKPRLANLNDMFASLDELETGDLEDE